MRLPPGYNAPLNTVLKLIKALYRLKQSGREWYGTLIATLLDMGFIALHFDPYVFKRDGLLVSIYVDDLLIFSKIEWIDAFKPAIAAKFKSKDIGKAKYILGLEIEYYAKHILLLQSLYAQRILQRFQMDAYVPRQTPLDASIFPPRTVEGDEPTDIKLY